MKEVRVTKLSQDNNKYITQFIEHIAPLGKPHPTEQLSVIQQFIILHIN